MKKINWNIVLLLLAVLVVAACLLWAGSAEFGGTDNKATEIIEASDYKPWFDYLFAPSSPLQAALGAGVLFYCIGYFVGRKSKQ